MAALSSRANYARLAEEPVWSSVTAEHAKTQVRPSVLGAPCATEDRPVFLWLVPISIPTRLTKRPSHSSLSMMNCRRHISRRDGLANKPFRQRFHQRNDDAIIPFQRRANRADAAPILRHDHARSTAEIGKILDFLDRRGLNENTLLVFTSDHGDYQGDHGMTGEKPGALRCAGACAIHPALARTRLTPAAWTIASRPTLTSCRHLPRPPGLRTPGPGAGSRSAAGIARWRCWRAPAPIRLQRVWRAGPAIQ